jgi:hypothetical protein
MSRPGIISCALLAVAACADPAPAPSEHDVVARIVGASLASGDGSGWVTSYADAISLALGGMPAGLARYEDVMVTGHHGAGAYGYMVRCLDAEGEPTLCSHRTESATVQAWSSVPVERADLDVAIHFQAAWSMTRVLGPMATLTGTSTLEIEGTIDGVHHDVISDVEHDLILPRGEWMMTIDGTSRLALRDRLGPRDPIAGGVQIAFDNGWETAEIAVGEQHRYRIHLTTGELCAEAALDGGVPPCSQPAE